MKKLTTVTALALCVALALTSCGNGGGNDGQDAVVTLTAGNALSMESPSSIALSFLSERAYELSGGTLIIEYFIASQLGNPVEMLEATSLGMQDIVHSGGTWISNYIPERHVCSMFFLFDSDEHFLNFLRSDYNAEIEERFRQEKGIIMIGRYAMAAPRSMVTTVPVHSLEDLDGLLFRSPDIRAYFESISALGLHPVQLAIAEVYLGLMQGIVDGACTMLDSIYAMNFFEAAPYVLITDHVHDNYAFKMNEASFNRLSQRQQDALLQATHEASMLYNEIQAENRYEFIRRMEERGATIIRPDTSAMREATIARMWELEAEGMWPEGMIEAILEMRP